MAKKKSTKTKRKAPARRYCFKDGCKGRPAGQEKTCPECGRARPARGWVANIGWKEGDENAKRAAILDVELNREAQPPLPSADVARITLEVNQRLSKGGTTLDELEAAKPLTVDDILARDDCPASIIEAAADGELAKKLKSLDARTYRVLKSHFEPEPANK